MGIAHLLSTRRWMTLSGVAVVLAVVCALLGRWQYDRSYRPVDGYSQEPAPVSIDAVDSAAHPLTTATTDRQVLLAGRYDAGQQRLIAGHVLDAAPVLWVVTPLRLTDGSLIEVVRGWISRVDPQLDAPPDSLVYVTGRIHSLQPPPSAIAPAAPGYEIAIDTNLLHQLPYPTRDGYVVRTAQTPPDPLSLQPVPSQAPPAPKGAKQFHLLSAFYTAQWWLFAVLILWAWQRLFSAELAERRGKPVAGREPNIALTTRRAQS